MLQQRQESKNQASGWLREAEKICIEVVESIIMAWEQLIDDETIKQLSEQSWQVDLQVLAMKEEINKLPPREKISKGAELK